MYLSEGVVQIAKHRDLIRRLNELERRITHEIRSRDTLRQAEDRWRLCSGRNISLQESARLRSHRSILTREISEDVQEISVPRPKIVAGYYQRVRDGI